ncbi:hypothetical protein EYL20_03405 [Neisseria gonorrhoeae]|uniref:hypothetical protein n=1 Tax=Neisseria gonorrhoeae TaxID=485 RepID=UPI0009E502DC|nr:hypothetical protein GHB96_07665 [Neisseria gonorrhoeae]
MKTANPHIVIPAKAALHSPPAPAIFTLKSRHSRPFVIPAKVGIWNVKSQETVLSDKFPRRQT